MSTGKMSHLKLATFERALDSFVAAGVHGLTDTLLGTSESIMTGTKMSLGTGGKFQVLTIPEAFGASTKTTKTVPLRLTVPPVLPLYIDPVIRKRLTLTADVRKHIPIRTGLLKQRPQHKTTIISTKRPATTTTAPKPSKKQRMAAISVNVPYAFSISRTP
jgi:hypothetical protein